jgi:hypothetical protein
MVGASILFFFGTSDIRSLTQVAPAAAKSRKAAPQDPGQAPTQPAPYDHDLQRLSEILGHCISCAAFATARKARNGGTKHKP